MPRKIILTDPDTNKKIRLNGSIRSSERPDTEELSQDFSDHQIYSADKPPPPKVDLRPAMTPIKFQGQVGSCTANALAGAYEYLKKKSSGTELRLSRLFIYYNARVEGNPSGAISDTGSSTTAAINGLYNYGVCLESSWAYDENEKNTRPSDEAYQEAEDHKITDALHLKTDLAEMKSCLAQGYPFAFGILLQDSFYQAQQTGVVPMPDLNQQSNKGHAMLAVGYSDRSQAFIVRNSWGEDWGAKGYCYIPYAYMTHPNQCYDAVVIRKVAEDDFNQDYWCNEDAVDFTRGGDGRRFGASEGGDNFTIEEVDEDD